MKNNVLKPFVIILSVFVFTFGFLAVSKTHAATLYASSTLSMAGNCYSVYPSLNIGYVYGNDFDVSATFGSVGVAYNGGFLTVQVFSDPGYTSQIAARTTADLYTSYQTGGTDITRDVGVLPSGYYRVSLGVECSPSASTISFTGLTLSYDGTWPSLSIASLNQYQSDATTIIAEGSIITEPTVVFGTALQSINTSTFQLQVEVQPAGSNFTGIPTITSPFVSSNATTSWTGPDGNYHWQARIMDSDDATSTWKQFGSSATSTDFTINTHPVPFNQAGDAASSIGSWYSDNWYQLGRGFGGTIHDLILEASVNYGNYYQEGDSYITLSEFFDPNYTSMVASTPLFSGFLSTIMSTSTNETLISGLNIILNPNRYYRLDTGYEYQNGFVVLRGTTVFGKAMYDQFIYGSGRVENYYQFYPYIVANKTAPPTVVTSSLAQYKSDATTTIAKGGTTTEIPSSLKVFRNHRLRITLSFNSSFRPALTRTTGFQIRLWP